MDKLWRAAVRKKAAEFAEGKSGPKKLEKAADALFAAAIAGDVSAMKEIGDRMDGKVPQGIIGGDENDPAIKTVTRVEIVALTAEKRD